jgi:hypothetical protein
MIVTGMFNINKRIPVDTLKGAKDPIILDRSWATPVNPLAYTFAGIRKKFIAMALSNAPTTTMIIFFISPLYILKTSISPLFYYLFTLNYLFYLRRD